MPKKDISKTEAKKKIEEFFLNIKQKSPEEFKKIKKIAMRNRISLGEYKPLFCKQCLMPYSGGEKIRIKNKIKTITCENCGYKKLFKLSSSS
jgi:RNase P subunit RPR2